MGLLKIADDLDAELAGLTFAPPVAHVYNPLVYARAPLRQYLERFGAPPKEAVFVGMNPGPWGMAQTGVPFGEVGFVRNWMGIEAEVTRPAGEHPKKRVTGFACRRSEVSGKRLWGLAAERFEAPKQFFDRFFVLNYCPLLFLDADGRNLTPDKLKASEQAALQERCDRALYRSIEFLKPRLVIGVGNFAEARAREALSGLDVSIGRILHPSPQNPQANKGWREIVLAQLAELGVAF